MKVTTKPASELQLGDLIEYHTDLWLEVIGLVYRDKYDLRVQLRGMTDPTPVDPRTKLRVRQP